MVALILAALALGKLSNMESIIEARVQAGTAKLEARLSSAEEVMDAQVRAGAAKTEATAYEARTHARVALDKVEDLRTELAKNGIKVELDGH